MDTKAPKKTKRLLLTVKVQVDPTKVDTAKLLHSITEAGADSAEVTSFHTKMIVAF